ncbi:MAG: GNAT family N-acetyltransferase [Saprospiraceae bacterium]|nr:GNAT family N-acetyltransferase [Saprospiraceae bacterium]
MIKSRKAKIDDLMLYFEWANDTLVRANSIHQAPIPLESHKNWFTQKVVDKDTFMYVLEIEGKPIGQLRIERKEEHALINYSMDKNFRGKGLGTDMLRMGIHAFQKETSPIILIGKVQVSNLASAKIFQKLGFDQKELESIKGEEYFVFHTNKSF